MKPFIGIKKIWYGEPLTTEPTAQSIAALIAGSTLTQVKNSHSGTWGYTQDDPNITDYENELTGTIYYRDRTSEGNKTVKWTMGEYDYADKAALQGGTVINGTGSTAIGWKAPMTPELIYKCVIAQTKTGNYVVFVRAGITAKVDPQEKNLGLGVTAIAMSPENNAFSNEYWFDGDSITPPTEE